MGKAEVIVCLSRDEEKPKLGAYYYKVTGPEVIQILKALQAEEGKDYIIDGDEVKISNKIIELKDANVVYLPEAKSIKTAFENALGKDQAIYDSKFAAKMKAKLGIVLPTRELIREKFEEALENKDNENGEIENFKKELEELNKSYIRADIEYGKERTLKEFIKANENFLKTIMIDSSNIYDLCVNAKQGKEIILRDYALVICKELLIDKEIKGVPTVHHHPDLEYDIGADTDTEKSHSPDVSSQSSEESNDDKQIQDQNIGKHTSGLERKSNKDRER